MGAVAAVVGVVGAVTGIGQIRESRRARREASAAAETDRRISQLQRRREQARTLAEAQVARSSVQQGAANAGIANTSVAQQGADSITGQAASNVSFVERVGRLQDESSRRLQAAANAGARANTFALAGSLATRIAGSFDTGGGDSNG